LRYRGDESKPLLGSSSITSFIHVFITDNFGLLFLVSSGLYSNSTPIDEIGGSSNSSFSSNSFRISSSEFAFELTCIAFCFAMNSLLLSNSSVFFFFFYKGFYTIYFFFFLLKFLILFFILCFWFFYYFLLLKNMLMLFF